LDSFGVPRTLIVSFHSPLGLRSQKGQRGEGEERRRRRRTEEHRRGEGEEELWTHRKILKISSISESPGNNGCLIAISAKIQPTDHISIAVE
jgi:hypothetical protein